MIIEKLEIKNFRCFKQAEFTLEQLSAIVGENGVGKTAILEAINFVLSPYYLSSRLNITDFCFSDNEKKEESVEQENVALGKDTDVEKEKDEINIIVNFDEAFDVVMPDGWQTQEIPCIGVALIAKKRQKGTAGKAFSDGFTTTHYLIPDESNPHLHRNGNKWSIPRKSADSKPFQFTSRNLIINNVEDSNLPRCFYFDKNRENQSKIGFNSTLSKVSEDFNWRFRKSISKNETEFVEQWEKIYNLILENVGNKQLKKVIIPLKEKCKELLGNDFSNLEISVMMLEEPFSKGFFSVRNGIHQIDKNSLGSGISMILSLLFLDIMSNLSKAKIIILVDEPELHLHPQLQDSLYEYLNKSSNQIIYTTHSENFVDVSGWRGIRRIDKNYCIYPKVDSLSDNLKYKNYSSSVEKHLDDITKFYIDKSSLLKEQNRIMFSQKCVIVEGPVDKYAFEFLAPKFNYNFKSLTIVAAHGKEKIKNLQLLCRAFSIQYFSVFDLDQKNDDDENNAIINFSFKDHWYYFEDSLETVLECKNARASVAIQKINDLKVLPEDIKELFDAVDKFQKC